MTSKKVDVAYSAGFLVCRQVGVDESSGEARDVPGLHVRVRAGRVEAYLQAEPGILEIYLEGRKDPLHVVGSIVGMETAMKRETIGAAKTPADE